MKTKIQKKEEINKEIFVGLDVHLNNWYATIMGEKIQDLKRTFEADAAKFVKYLNQKYPDSRFKIAYESGCFGFWIKEELEKYPNIEVFVINAADVPTSHKDKTSKNDRIDSIKLAMSLKGGLLKSIYAPSREWQEYRSLMRQRESLVKDQTRVKQKIKAQLKYFGIGYPEEFKGSKSHWTRKFIAWLKQINFKTAEGRISLDSLLRQLEFLHGELLEIQKAITKLSKKDGISKPVEILTSIPGVALISAMTIITEIIDYQRFSNDDKLVSFVGLCPTEHSSGDKQRYGKMSKRHNKRLRKIFIESAWTAIRYDDKLRLQYITKSIKSNKSKAIITVSKKLLKITRTMILNNEKYKITRKPLLKKEKEQAAMV